MTQKLKTLTKTLKSEFRPGTGRLRRIRDPGLAGLSVYRSASLCRSVQH